jgi:hypothetical protein
MCVGKLSPSLYVHNRPPEQKHHNATTENSNH